MKTLLGLALCAVVALGVRRIVGGLESIDVDDGDAQAAANFATQEMELILVSVDSAKSQVVAGTMFHLDITVKDDEISPSRSCFVKVVKNLPVYPPPMELVEQTCLTQ